MNALKNDTISNLKRQILQLGGFKTLRTDNTSDIGLKAIEQSFPNAVFPIGCVHEFIPAQTNHLASVNGFIAGLAGKIIKSGGVCVWVSHNRTLFPAALNKFNLKPHQVIFIDLKKEKDCLYVIEDALKCNQLSVVIGELEQIGFKESRRLQLAAEQSRVTAFLIRKQVKTMNTIAAVSRWQIRSLPSETKDGLPGVGFPRWQVELLKVRNGNTGEWIIEWAVNSFVEIQPTLAAEEYENIKNAG